MQKDIKEKRLEEHNDVFADIFNNLLFDGKAILKKRGFDHPAYGELCAGSGWQAP